MEPMTADERLLQQKFDRVYQLAREAENLQSGGPGPSDVEVQQALWDLPSKILEALTEGVEVPSADPELYAELIMKEGAGRLTEGDRKDLQTIRESYR